MGQGGAVPRAALLFTASFSRTNPGRVVAPLRAQVQVRGGGAWSRAGKSRRWLYMRRGWVGPHLRGGGQMRRRHRGWPHCGTREAGFALQRCARAPGLESVSNTRTAGSARKWGRKTGARGRRQSAAHTPAVLGERCEARSVCWRAQGEKQGVPASCAAASDGGKAAAVAVEAVKCA
ncbi:MAG: hypothetical protein J3K34DRAFT_419588 [Monoraphidium minutum]|nr:MAG: hypothetical protein J3K34DRAFT_419588 [Monoraphidium minutum]